ncbi:hypothetical protein [Thiorhodococcus minor]|uniref:Uncharacterized protein n=1 Tax=Thiorhodococcus minor TaxID=57489 RepID=A0A6M0K2Z3_9GAMM|nr:hypothetical protein [Thiorhodococcus minor]NEV63323.1 hypothetical protein [Thiorhodococcus minor]
MPYRDQDPTQRRIEQQTAGADWACEQTELQLQPWAEPSQGAHVANRFGKFERQIEADVLRNLNPFLG